jgi:hypothetical protein
MSAGTKAVFLSYASQDADAARKICDALRAAGVEVWFDQSELRGGDAWDAKIRKQIKECALFVPVISANTQARREGYFRLEWKLAEDRTHLMAKGTPFLLPVCIDDTKDWDAVVPDSFMSVQWTRLPVRQTPDGPGDEMRSAFAERIAQLLAGGTTAPMEPARLRPTERGGSTAPAATPPAARRVPVAAWIAAAVVVGAVLYFAIHPHERVTARPVAAEKSAAAPSEAARLAEESRRHYSGIFTREDLTLAEDFARRATELEPELAAAWGARAGANAAYLLRGFVHGEAEQQRARDAQAFGNRALALNKDDIEALLALGLVADDQGARSQGEALYRRVLALDPGNPFASRFLSISLRYSGRIPEAVAVMQEAVRRLPHDALTHFDLALAYACGWNFTKAVAECDRARAEQPFPGALVWEAWIMFLWQGDLVKMRALLEQTDIAYRGEEEALMVDLMCGLCERRPDHVREAAGRTPRDFLEQFTLPIAWFTAQAYELEKKENLARREWHAAETLLQEKLRTAPQRTDFRLLYDETAARLGRAAEVRDDVAAIEATWREEVTPLRAYHLAHYYAAAGEAAKAVDWLRQCVNRGVGMSATSVYELRLDPWWDKIRDTPEFQALLAHPPPEPAPVEAP